MILGPGQVVNDVRQQRLSDDERLACTRRRITIKMADTIKKSVHSGKTFFDCSVNTGQIYMGFEADTSENERKMLILCDFRIKIWLKCY